MDTNSAHDRNYRPQAGAPHAQGDSGPRPHLVEQADLEPDLSQPRRSDSAAGSGGDWSTIREMANDFGVSIRALRFYEDRGLLHPRREGTARRYNTRDRLHLKMILKGKQLGFTLSEIHEILASRETAIGDPDAASALQAPTDYAGSEFEALEAELTSLEMGLPPEQIVAQINHLERQRKGLDEAILALRHAHQRLIQSRPRAAAT